MAPESDSTAPTRQRPVFATRSNFIAATILLASAMWLAWWFWERSSYVFVSDARISATMVTLSARVPGWITSFTAEEAQHVSKNEILGEIDAREARIELAEVDAALRTVQAEYAHHQRQLALREKQIDSRIEAQKSKLEAVKSTLMESRVALDQAEKDWRRAQSLLDQELISHELYEQRKVNYDRARETLNQRRAQLAEAQAVLAEANANRGQVDVLRAQLEVIKSRRQELEVKRRRAQVKLDDHTIRSPITGVLDETFINPGEFVRAGQRMVLLHNPDDIWVSANVKETEVRHIHNGSTAFVEVDALPGKILQGEIVRVGNAATSEFSLLPSPNPSGNFTKITQRLEIKVDIDQVDGLLKPGMMVELKIAIE